MTATLPAGGAAAAPPQQQHAPRPHTLRARCAGARCRASCRHHHVLLSQQHHHHLQQQQHHQLPGSSRRSVVAHASNEPVDEPGISKEQLASSEERGVVFSQTHGDVGSAVQFPLEVPLLPFPVEEVLLPGSLKSLHLFEARYLALLDAVLAQPGPNKLFAHVVIEAADDVFGETAAQFPGAYSSEGEEFVLSMATLVRVVEVKRSFVGALVRVQAEACVSVTDITQAAPYLVGRVALLPDGPLEQPAAEVQQQLDALAQTMRDLQNLTQRFKSRQQASLLAAMYWADRPALVHAAAAAADGAAAGTPAEQQQQQQAAAGDDSSSNSLAERAVRMSFAALQGVPQESTKDTLKLLRCCVNAMKTRDTATRIAAVQAHMSASLATLAAKCALASLNLGGGGGSGSRGSGEGSSPSATDAEAGEQQQQQEPEP